MKKKSVFLGNCHNAGIITHLKKSPEFVDTYEVEQYTNWELMKYKISPPIESIKKCDLFIFQPLPAIYGCYSTYPDVPDSIGSFVKENCIKVSFPYTFCSSLWPLIQSEKGKNRWFGWEPIHNLKKSGMSVKEILEHYKNGLIDWEYEKRFSETISILKEKEKYTDIIISDFIINNLKKEPLFLIPQHPTSIVFLEIANQILEKLKMPKLDNSSVISENEAGLPDSTYDRINNKFPIHKSVAEFYNFEYSLDEEDSQTFYFEKIINYLNMNDGEKTPEKIITRDWEYKI